MTEQEAIKVLEEKGKHIEMIKIDGKDTLCYRAILVEAFEVATKALEKQIPKKPYLDQKGLLDVKMWHCPVCKKEVISDWNRDLANAYCHHCGQKLDWE